MSKRQGPDTEPDDAFSLILGDVNNSPLMRPGSRAEDPFAPSQQPEADASLRPNAAAAQAFGTPLPPHVELLDQAAAGGRHHSAALQHPGVAAHNGDAAAKTQPPAPSPEPPAATPPQAPPTEAAGQAAAPAEEPQHPWLGVQLDTCTVTPPGGLLESGSEEDLLALREALLHASQQDVAVIRLDLAQQGLHPRALALALDCSRMLRHKESQRLVLSNCPPALKRLLDALQLQARHDIACS